MLCHAGSAAQARRTAKGELRQFCRVPGVAPETSSVRTQTVHEFYTVAADAAFLPLSVAVLSLLPAAALPTAASTPPLPVDPVPMDDEEEQELLPGD